MSYWRRRLFAEPPTRQDDPTCRRRNARSPFRASRRTIGSLRERFDLPDLSLGRRVEFVTIFKDVDEARACKLGRPQDFTGLSIEGEDPVFCAAGQMLGQVYRGIAIAGTIRVPAGALAGVGAL